MSEEQTQQTETSDGRRKTRTGKVVSDSMDKTAVVSVTRKFKHPMYKKYVRDRKHHKVHDEEDECKVGDKILIEETRPISKDKRWRVLEILEEAPTV
jgi:small subunit ribosomal protein S17